MPPSSSQPKTGSQPAKDIRSFFGGASGSSSAKTTNGVKTSKHFMPTPQSRQSPEGKDRGHAIQIDDGDGDEPVPTKSRRISTKRKPVIESSEDEDVEMEAPPPKKATPNPRPSLTSSRPAQKSKPKDILSDDDEDSPPPKKQLSTPKATPKPTPKAQAAKPAPKPRPSVTKAKPKKIDDDYELEEEEEEEDTKKTKKNKERVDDDSKPAAAKKFNWAAAKAAKLAGPSAPGSKAVPEGSPNCLAGLTFVFTGELTSFARDEAVEIAKRFGGRVTGQPSSKTSYVVLGDNAGPSKIAAIKKNNLKTLNEDEFLALIASRKSSDADEKTKQKIAKEEENIRKAAEDMERAERKAEKERVRAATSVAGPSKPKVDTQSQLWTTRYAPQNLKEICGNKTQVERLQGWLHDWSSSLKSGFKKPGKNGMNIYRAVCITGPPGIGKTTSAHLCAKLEGFTPIEVNASDARSKKLIENSTNITNTSLDGFLGGNKATNVVGMEITNKSCLIMDEVDGMSAGDRGGVGALNQLIKKTKIPIICIANDRNAQKMKPLLHTTFNLSFRRPEATSIRSRIMTIAFKEKMKIPANVIDELVQGAQSDIRQVLNMLSTWKLSSNTMDFDEGKNLARMNEKYTIMTPFNVTQKILGPYLFSPTARETLNEKMELYFHDHAFVPLFIQENYLKTEPAKVRNATGPEKALQQLRLMDKASSSISDGDLVDALIHGPEQHWSLMPLHAVLSTVRPASFLYGNGAGYGGPNAMSFPQWLGQNSKQNKLQRQLGDVQIRMRLRVSGDKPEIRQQYIPALWPKLVKPLIDVGSSSVDEVIETMDDYYLSKEEWDTIIELGVGDKKDDAVLKQISAPTKTQLTRKYNTGDHPVPFHKAQGLGKAPKKIEGGPAPDLEEAFDADDTVPDDEPDAKDEDADDMDITKDSLIKAGGKGKGKASAGSKAKVTKTKGKK